MNRMSSVAAIASLLILGFLILPMPVSASCTRTELQAAVDRYISAQKTGNSSALPLSEDVRYSENLKTFPLEIGILSHALPIAFHRDFLDTHECRTFSEIVVTGSQPYVMSVRLTVNGGAITEIESIVATEGDWKFSAENYLKYSPEEDWHLLTPEERVDRQTIINAANAWMDQFTYEGVKVPWGIPCARLEGGDYTGDGPRVTCKVGIPIETIEIVNRSFVIDEDMGTVNVLSRFGKTAKEIDNGGSCKTPGSADILSANP